MENEGTGLLTIEREARCACGQLRARCKGKPMKLSLCHCSQCRLRTGSAFGVAVFFAKDNVEPAGESRTYTRIGDSGMPLHFHFCPDCGGTVYWYPERMPERAAVALGAFTGDDLPAPEQAVYEDRALSWARGIIPGKRP